MYKIQTLNKISAIGLDLIPRDNYEIASEFINPDAIIVRSFNMIEMDLPGSVKVIARAGAGVNNIPVDKCTAGGVVVLNTPGANANSVKELVLTGLLISSRKIIPGIIWGKSLVGKGDEIPKLVEKGKSNFTGSELKGKRIGVIGLGAIGVMVANDALELGMHVTGYDPFISVEAAWGLSRNVKRARGLESLLAESDYVTLHVPLSEKTRGLFNRERFMSMKKGACLLNFARGGLVNNSDLFEAISSGIISTYVTDFPDEELLKNDNVIALPHLGASTAEAEENCAIMAVNQTKEFLECGNIKNSVNFPDCEMDFTNSYRIIIANRNIPNMVGQISTTLATEKINISDMINRHKGDVAYNIIDLDNKIEDSVIQKLREIEGVIMVRLIQNHRK